MSTLESPSVQETLVLGCPMKMTRGASCYLNNALSVHKVRYIFASILSRLLVYYYFAVQNDKRITADAIPVNVLCETFNPDA